MKELARIQFRGDTRLFETAWNGLSPHKIEYGVVAIFKDDPAYQEMRELFDTYARNHLMSWHEHVDVEYSLKELRSFELLRLHILGRAGAGNNALAEVYVTQQVCQSCGRVRYHQVRDLVLDLGQVETDPYEIPYFRHDLCETDFHEVVVSEKLRRLLVAQEVAGVFFRPVESVSEPGTVRQPYYQLLVELEIGPLVEPSQIERLARCRSCQNYKEVLLDALPGTRQSEFYFRRADYSGAWIMRTTDEFGRGPRYGPKVIINQSLYRLLRSNRITGFAVQPAHLV